MNKAFVVKSRGLFDPKLDKPFKISRSGIELHLNCPRCFYLNHRLGICRPPGPPFTINSLVGIHESLGADFEENCELGGTGRNVYADLAVTAALNCRINMTGFRYPGSGGGCQGFRGIPRGLGELKVLPK